MVNMRHQWLSFRFVLEHFLDFGQLIFLGIDFKLNDTAIEFEPVDVEPLVVVLLPIPGRQPHVFEQLELLGDFLDALVGHLHLEQVFLVIEVGRFLHVFLESFIQLHYLFGLFFLECYVIAL
jgi:hypothetical protein